MLTAVRKQGIIPWLGPDSKSQVTVEYNDDSTVKRIDKVVCSNSALRTGRYRDCEGTNTRSNTKDFASRTLR